MPPEPDLDIHLEAATAAGPHVERRSSRTNVLLLGDFSGRRGRGGRAESGAESAGPAVPRLVDRDSVDRVMAALDPSISLGGGVRVGFDTLDAFHPDALFGRVPALGAALEGRGSVAGAEPAGTAPDPEGSVLDRILGETPQSGRPSRPPEEGPLGSVRAFAAEAARFDSVDAPRPGAAERAASTRARTADALRAFLRIPAFRRVERAWRSVDFIVRRLDTGPALHVYLADLPRSALAREPDAPGGIEASALRATLAAGAGPDGEPWSWVTLLDGSIGPGNDDALLLAWLTGLCAAYGATLLVDGEPELAGIADLDDFTDPSAWGGQDVGWSAFRRQPEARAVGVALPGFLLREPYGADTDPIDAIPFEEITGVPARDDYLVAGGAVACTIALARADARVRSADDADRDPAGSPPDLTVRGIPLHIWRHGVETGTTGGAAAMSDAAARRLLEAGLIPVAWARGGDEVRLLVPRSAGGTALV